MFLNTGPQGRGVFNQHPASSDSGNAPRLPSRGLNPRLVYAWYYCAERERASEVSWRRRGDEKVMVPSW